MLVTYLGEINVPFLVGMLQAYLTPYGQKSEAVLGDLLVLSVFQVFILYVFTARFSRVSTSNVGYFLPGNVREAQIVYVAMYCRFKIIHCLLISPSIVLLPATLCAVHRTVSTRF